MRRSTIHRLLPACLALPALCLGLTSGPNLPEYNNFEPVTATDMVNLSSGNFAWSQPVMTVPGPSLGFPILLNYHAGIGQKEEASWVGLGWNLQAGAITRQVNNLPDDLKDAVITETIRTDAIQGWGVSIGYMGATVGIAIRGGEATGGTIGFDPIALAAAAAGGGAGAAASTQVHVGIPISVGFGSEAGASIGLSLALGNDAGQAGLYVGVASRGGQTSASASAGLSAARGLASMSAGLSTNGGLSVGAALAGAYQAGGAKGQQHFSSSGFSLPIPIVPTSPFGWVSLGFSKWSAWIEGLDNDHHYGFLFAHAEGMSCTGAPGSINCHTGSYFFKRHEFSGATQPYDPGSEVKMMKTSEDVYIVSAEGISGAFKPGHREDGDYMNTLEGTSRFVCSSLFSCGRRHVDRTARLDANSDLLSTTNDLYWRYTDDPGGAEYTVPTDRTRTGAKVSIRSRRIEATFDGSRLTGFRITNSNGTTYVFGFPLYNIWEYKTGRDYTGTASYTTQENANRYAYAWLITSIEAPDFVDLDPQSINPDERGPDDGDIGGWVKMTYGDGTGAAGVGKKPLQGWRTPYYRRGDATYTGLDASAKDKATFGPAPLAKSTKNANDDVIVSQGRQSAEGLKEIAYLYSVETATHKAYFNTASRDDNIPFEIVKSVFIPRAVVNGDWTYPDSVPLSFLSLYSSHVRSRMAWKIRPGQELFSGVPDSKLRAGQHVTATVIYDPYIYDGLVATGTTCEVYAYLPDHKWTFNDYVVDNVSNHDTVYTALKYGSGTTCGPQYGNGYAKIRSVEITSRWWFTNQSRRLVSITLRNKLADNEKIGHVRFNTDYSLAENTPNSDAATTRGKLTLKSFQVGADSTGPFLPPYEFKYAYNPKFQTGATWVGYEKGQWDRWGNLCTECDDAYHEPSPPNPWEPHEATAWSLTQIKAPSGAVTMMRYAPKRYRYIGVHPVAEKISSQWKIQVASGNGGYKSKDVESNEFEMALWGPYVAYYRVPIAGIRKKIIARGLRIRDFRLQVTARDTLALLTVGPTEASVTPLGSGYFPGHLIGIPGGCSATGAYCTGGYLRGFDRSLDTSLLHGKDEFWISIRTKIHPLRQAHFKLQVMMDAAPDNSFQFVEEDVAAGIVTTQVDLQEPFDGRLRTMKYTYDSGVTASLPPTFSDYDDSRELSGTGEELYKGGAGITYPGVTAASEDGSRMRYSFLTSKDLPVFIGAHSPPTQEATDRPYFSTLTIADMSGLWGALWKKEEFARGAIAPTRTTQTHWGINKKVFPFGYESFLTASLNGKDVLEELPKDNTGNYYMYGYYGVYLPTGNFTNDNARNVFGVVQTVASHRYFNSTGCYQSNGCPQSLIMNVQTVFQRYSPVAQRTEVTTDGLKSPTYFYQPDFRSGRLLKSRKVNSDNSSLVTMTIPAWDMYTPMERRNQYDQNFFEGSYYYPAGSRSDFYSDETPAKGVSAKVTLWRPYFQNGLPTNNIMDPSIQAFRKYASYEWVGVPGSTTLYVPGSYPCRPGATCTYDPGLAVPAWSLRERFDRYDEYGHPVNVSDAHGLSITTLYGYGSSLPTASIVDSRGSRDPQFKPLSESFELASDLTPKLSGTAGTHYALSEENSKTGRRSLDVKNLSGSGFVCLNVGNLTPNVAYEASAWYFDETDGSSPTSPYATRPAIFLGKYPGCYSESELATATGSRQWKRISTRIEPNQCPAASQIAPAIVCIYASKNRAGSDILFDELRVSPAQSRMSTYAYDSRGHMISSADANEVVTRYEYDRMGNLTGIRNDDGVLVSERANKNGKR